VALRWPSLVVWMHVPDGATHLSPVGSGRRAADVYQRPPGRQWYSDSTEESEWETWRYMIFRAAV